MTSLVEPGTALDPYEAASADVRGYCNQVLSFVADDVVLIDPRPDRTAQLPEMPVTAVTSVEAYMPDDSGAWGWQSLTYPGQYGWAERGLMWDATRIEPSLAPGDPRPGRTWPWLPGSLRVTYSHGYNPVPDGIAQIVLRLAAQYAVNPSALQSHKVGEVAAVFGVPGSPMLRPEECVVLDRYTVQDI